MASRSLRSQLNQIRAWVREGRTDAWIAHQLEVSASELRDFRRRHGLAADSEPSPADDLRDEIEAEVEAATLEEDEQEDEEDVDEDDLDGDDLDEGAEDEERPEPEARDKGRGRDEDEDEGRGDGEQRRRRRRRGGRGRRRARRIEASFDHGERDGYGLWLDASVKENATYSEHWAGHRRVEVTIEPDQIVIRRSE